MITPARPISPAAAAMAQAASATLADHDWLADLLAEARQRIRAQLTPAQIEDPSAQDMATGEGIVTPLVDAFFATARREGVTITVEPAAVVREIIDSIFGFGPLAAYMADPEIEEIICNHHADIRIIHAVRGKEQTTARFRQASELINFVNRAARDDGRQIDRAHPELNAKMKDGSRLHAIMKPLTAKVEIAVTIRRHRLVARTLDDLTRLGTLTPTAAEFLKLAIAGRLNLVVAGSTGSGKTNFVNALGNAAADDDRFVIIEDTTELQIAKSDVVQLCTRHAAEQARAYTIADLVVAALRMRPDRIITGEARGPEIVDVLMAANTGHDGQLLTIHANSTRDVIQRMETMYLMRGSDVPLLAIRRQVADAFQVVVFLRRVEIGGKPRRFVTEIAELLPSQFMEGDKVVVQNIFEDKGHGLNWTGYFPERLARRLQENGVTLRPNFFRG